MPDKTIQTQCCIAGGGPAGVMMGYLLARAGVNVVIMEKHKDFFRDFRGDTIHPSTLELMHQLGLLDDLLRIRHEDMSELYVKFGRHIVQIADFSKVPVHCHFISFMPQWDFLNFLTDRGNKYPGFKLMMETEATDLIVENGIVKGIKAKTADSALEIKASLCIAADGRSSMIREKAGLKPIDKGVPIDVLWLRIPKIQPEEKHEFGYFDKNTLMILIDRKDYYQCGVVIPKGDYDRIKAEGIDRFKQAITSQEPVLAEGLKSLQRWEDIQLLTVQINHLPTWYRDGLLCIGDAAHAMSPAFGVGINLAIQDAVAAANMLAGPLKTGNVSKDILAQIQKRRSYPTRVIQNLQAVVHNLLLNPKTPISSGILFTLFFTMFRLFPFLKYKVAKLIGIGLRPEKSEL